ncbi:MAG: glycosyltransferase family 4 protein [Candidatus Velthaea sp.]
MKIGIVSTRVGRNDGVGRVNYEIAMEALRAGHEITLFCEAVDRDLSGRPDVQLELMPAEWLPTRLLKDVLFAWRLNRRLSIKAIDEARNGRHSCDAILANGLVSWSAADVNAVHFVHSSWRCSPHHPWHRRRNAYTMYRRLYNDFGAMLDNVSYRRSKAIVAVSNRVRQELIDIGVPSAVITTIVNGVDASEFRPGPGERSRFGLPERARIGLCAQKPRYGVGGSGTRSGTAFSHRWQLRKHALAATRSTARCCAASPLSRIPA